MSQTSQGGPTPDQEARTDSRVIMEAADAADKKEIAKVQERAQEAVREELDESRPEINKETKDKILKNGFKSITDKETKRRAASDAEPMDFSEFWVENGEARIPMYPFKPFVKIRFLSGVKTEIADPGSSNERILKPEYNDIYEVPFNYLTNFTVTTHPYARAQITISDTEFKNIENFSMRALALYNETIRKIQKGYWAMSAMEIPSFCQLTWGYIGKDPDKRVESSVLSFILLGFKYSIGQTWLTINLDLIGNSQYFFNVTKFAVGKLGKIRPTNGPEEEGSPASDNDEFEIYRFIETALKRFGLDNWRHYALGPTTGVNKGKNEFIRKISVGRFNTRLKKVLAAGASVADFVQRACEIQLEDGAYAALKKEEQPMGVAVITARPGDDEDFERYGLIKRWILKPGPAMRDDRASRIYEWKRSPTSVITQMSADIPDGYFLGYTSLSFLGYTLNDDGQISMHVVQVGDDGDVRTIADLERVDIPDEQMEYLREAEKANRLQDNIKKLEKKLRTTEDEAIAIEGTDEYKKLIKVATKGDDGVWRFTGTGDEAKKITELDKKLGVKLKNIIKYNAELDEKRAEARTYINRSFHEFITNPANTQYIPIDLSTGNAASADSMQTRTEQDRFLSRNLLNTIADDMVATLNMTILGDPWLDGVHIDLVKARVRIIVNRPDNEPSVLSNDYFFFPNELRHTINSSGYTTSFTLKTAHDFLERAEELEPLHGGT